MHSDDTSNRNGWRSRRFLGRPWQDLVFAAAEVVFIVTLVPLLLSDTDVPAFTSIGTTVMLSCIVVVQVSYRNWITVILTAAAAVMWALIAAGV